MRLFQRLLCLAFGHYPNKHSAYWRFASLVEDITGEKPTPRCIHCGAKIKEPK